MIDLLFMGRRLLLREQQRIGRRFGRPGRATLGNRRQVGDEADLTLYAATVASLGTADIVWKKICDRRDAVRSFAVSGGAIFLVTTGGPAHAVVLVDLAEPAFAKAETVFASTDMVVETVAGRQEPAMSTGWVVVVMVFISREGGDHTAIEPGRRCGGPISIQQRSPPALPFGVNRLGCRRP